MKRRLAIVFGCFLATGFSAFSQTGGIRVKVPLNFYVAGKAFAAGEYTVSSIRDSVVLWDSHGNRVAMVLSNSIRQKGGATGGVAFDCDMGRCYLSQLRTPDPDRSREVLRGKEEIEIARHKAATPLVVVGSRAE